MQKIDSDTLTIIDQIKRFHTELSSEVGEVGNIFLVFAHDLVAHFSGILIQREAQEYYADDVSFPHINKQYAISPYRVGTADFQIPMVGHGFKAHLRRLPLSHIALGEALPFGYRQDSMVAKWVNLIGSYKPFVQAFLPRHKNQMQMLHDLIMQICSSIDIPGREAIWANWHQYVSLHTTSDQQALRERGLLLGTRNNLQNRKLATNYLQQGKEVVAVTHGEVANSVMDEPPFGYSERSLCSTLVDYGDFDLDGIYNRPWMLPRKRLYRSGSSAFAVYQPSDHIVLPDRSRSRALYIPTTYTGNGLYGPFHAYEDAIYRQWQSGLFEAFPNLTFKVHPKSRSAPLQGVTLDNRQLEDCIGEYDLLVFDYFATGSMLALVSDKPVIYCDIGLRQLHTDFFLDLKNRCEYVKIDLNSSIKPQLNDASLRWWSNPVRRSNEKIKRYVFCEKTVFNWIDLFRALERGQSPAT